jgi:hypothetical protein
MDTITAPSDTELEALVGPVAYSDWQRAAPCYHERLAAWARTVPSMDDDEFVDEAASAIHGSALTNRWRGNWYHEDFKASVAYHEAVRRHVASGHTADCRGQTLYSIAYHQVARSQGHNWAQASLCDGTCSTETKEA